MALNPTLTRPGRYRFRFCIRRPTTAVTLSVQSLGSLMTNPMNNKDISLEKLILASRSPRRAEILSAVGWPFEAVAADIDESVRAGEDAVHYVKRLALTKAQTVARKSPENLVLGADTTVMVGGELLGQPVDDDDARRMLKLLSGN